MKVLITGASSGIGKEMAIYLSELGYELVLVSKNKDKLMSYRELLKTKVTYIDIDLSHTKKVFDLLNKLDDVEIVINNAGIGLFGDYKDSDISKELELIDVNVKALQIITNYFIKKENTKYIMNVASTAGLVGGGPLMGTYYASKSYVCNYTLSLYEELEVNNSKIHISLLCPGPVKTDFNKRMGINNYKGDNPSKVARYGIDMMFKNKLIIIPGFKNKIAVFFSRFIPKKIFLRIMFYIQNKKDNHH